MPLHKLEWTSPGCGWAVWRIEEDESTLSREMPGEQCPSEIHSTPKRLEWWAARVLLNRLLADAGLIFGGVLKDEFGKPFLKSYPHFISLSHSFPYIAVQIDTKSPVGIDVEQPKSKLLRVAPRILSPTEVTDAGNDVVKNCVYWCAKESLYKIHGKRGLVFSKHLLVDPFEIRSMGRLRGRIIGGGSQLITLGYHIQSDFVLVFTVPTDR